MQPIETLKRVSARLSIISATMRDAGNEKIADKLFREIQNLDTGISLLTPKVVAPACPVPDCHLNEAPQGYGTIELPIPAGLIDAHLKEQGYRCEVCGASDPADVRNVYEEDQPTSCWAGFHGQFGR